MHECAKLLLITLVVKGRVIYMEFKKISDSKFQCLLYEEDLEDNDISLDDFFRNDTIKIHSLLDVVMEKAQESIGIELSGSVMSLQLAPQADHSLLLTISSGEDELGNMIRQAGMRTAQAASELRSYRESGNNIIKRDTDEAENNVKEPEFKSVRRDEEQDESIIAVDIEENPVSCEAAICRIETLDNIEQFCSVSPKTWGIRNTLYKDAKDGSFYLMMDRGRSSKTRFGQFINALLEYGEFIPYTEDKAAYIREHFEVYIAENAVNIVKKCCGV